MELPEAEGSQTLRLCSWNPVGFYFGAYPCTSSWPLSRYSILPAITVDGIIYSHIKEGSYNGDQFMEWLDGLLQVMNPYPAPRSVLILDNCRIHHVEGVEERCEER